MLIAQCTSCVCLIAAGRRNQRLRDFPLPLSLLFSSLEYRPRIGPPALITAPILAVLRVFLSVNRDELLIFRSIAAQFPPLLEAFVIEGIHERFDRSLNFFFFLHSGERNSIRRMEKLKSKDSVYSRFYRKLESGTDNGVTIVVLIELK